MSEPTSEPSTSQRRTTEELLGSLAELGGRLTAEDDVLFSGQKFVLPETMDIRQAIEFLKKKADDDEEETEYSRVFKYRPWDGARATGIALKKAFGAVLQKAQWSFFTGKVPPSMIDIDVDYNRTESIPWGVMEIAPLPGCTLRTSGTADPELGPLFTLFINGPKKWRFHIEGIFRMIEAELDANSMYRGKAFDGQTQPKFLDLSGVDPKKVVYSEDVMHQLEANVWALLRWPDKMEEVGVSLKRAVLFEGPYGTGKTLAAFLTAREAVENGWTFIYCRPGRDDIRSVFQTARLYQPCAVFFEDVDAISDVDDANRTDVSMLLDMFDGVQAKGTRIMAVLTTNHPERIHKGMVRPGRLDAVISVNDLDAVGIERLVRARVPVESLDENTDFDIVWKACEGMVPAFVVEAIDRAVRYNITRNAGKLTAIGTDDLRWAAEGLRPQLLLMAGARDEKALPTLDRSISAVIRERLEPIAERLDVDLGD